jgi:hypothetical protein
MIMWRFWKKLLLHKADFMPKDIFYEFRHRPLMLTGEYMYTSGSIRKQKKKEKMKAKKRGKVMLFLNDSNFLRASNIRYGYFTRL